MPRDSDPFTTVLGLVLAGLLAGAALSVGMVLATRIVVEANWHPVVLMRCTGQATCNAGGKP